MTGECVQVRKVRTQLFQVREEKRNFRAFVNFGSQDIESFLKTVQYLMGTGKEKQLFFAVCEPWSISDKKKKQVRNWATEHLAYATQMEPLYCWVLIIRQVQVGVQALDEQCELQESFKSLTSKDSVYIAIHVKTQLNDDSPQTYEQYFV